MMCTPQQVCFYGSTKPSQSLKFCTQTFYCSLTKALQPSNLSVGLFSNKEVLRRETVGWLVGLISNIWRKKCEELLKQHRRFGAICQNYNHNPRTRSTVWHPPKRSLILHMRHILEPNSDCLSQMCCSHARQFSTCQRSNDTIAAW